ncbi:MAG: hypothetical protein RIB03_11545 [Henriciella sp.]|uniref:hypothetical protein n=1 Tax=Henriciella sp. TaxID=1968823 RepID=UPI0032EDD4B7
MTRAWIIVTGVYEGDAPDPADWTLYTPRQPWRALDHDVIAAALEAFRQVGWQWAETGLISGPQGHPE